MELQSSDVESDISSIILDYLEILAKQWKKIAACTFSVTLITAVCTMFMPNVYTAKTMVIPGEDEKGSIGTLMAQLGGLANVAGGAVGTKAPGELYITMLKSETIKDRIIDRFKLLAFYKAKYRADVYKKLDGKTKISLGKKDGVISIAVSDTDPVLAANIGNAYVDELVELTSSMSISKATDNRRFLEKRIIEAKTDLARAEEALKRYQSQNKVVSLDNQAQSAISGIAQLRATLASKEVELGTLTSQFSDSSHEVKTAKAAIANIKAQIGRLEGNSEGSSILTVGSIPQLGQEYFRIMREFKVQEAVLEMLTKQYEAAKISEYKDVSPLQVLQKAKVPEKKSKPVRTKIVKTALILSLLASACLAIFVEKGRLFYQTLDQDRIKALFNRT